MQQHIVSVSSGLSSALAYHRVAARYGRENVIGVFENTLIEDDGNYRFLNEIERAWGMQLVRLTEGRTPYQVFEDQGIIPNGRVAPCTRRLKVNLFRDWLATLPDRDIIIHIGYDFSEVHRCAATTAGYAAAGYQVDYPLLWQPLEYRPYVQVCREDWGIEPPRMYGMGFTHANCGGRCVKAGHGDWIRTLLHFPERYAACEAWEERMRQNPTNADYAILKDRRGKTFHPLTLRELRERYEQRQPGQMELSLLDEETGGCIYCGVGDLLGADATDAAPVLLDR